MKPNIKILLKAIGIAILVFGCTTGYIFGLWALGEIWLCIGLGIPPFLYLVYSLYQCLKDGQ